MQSALISFDTVTDVRSLTTRPPTIVYDCAFWIWRASDQSANVAADPSGANWIAPFSDLSGESGAWERRVIASGTDPDALLWEAAVVAAGGTVSDARLVLISNVYAGLKSLSLKDRLDRCCLIAGENAISGYMDLITLTSITPVNSPAFTVDRGVKGDGLTSYVDLGLPGPTFTQNSASLFFYSRTDHAVANAIQMGSSSAANAFNAALQTKWSDGNTYASLNDGNTYAGVTAPSVVSGLWAWTRNSSTAFSIYQGGSLFATASGITSTDIPSQFIGLGCAPDNHGTPSFFSADQFAACGFGAGMTVTDMANLASVIDTYLIAVGAAV